MKLTRKLIPAFAMLLIAAVMMSTASFAWFSIRTDVTANGMSVTATVPASLEISADKATWDYTADLDAEITDKADRLHPITYFKADGEEVGKWYVPSAKNVIYADGGVAQEIGTATIATGHWTEIPFDKNTGKFNNDQYALVDKLYLRTNAGNVTDEAQVAPIHVVATVQKSAGDLGESTLMAGVTVYILEGESVYNISKGEAPADGWVAPLGTESSLELTVLIVYDGTHDAIQNKNADLKPTNIEISFNKKV